MKQKSILSMNISKLFLNNSILGGLIAVLVLLNGCAPEEKYDSEFYRSCKDKNKSDAVAHTIKEILKILPKATSCEQAHNYLMRTSSLLLSSRDIEDITPLKGLPELKELVLSGNNIKDPTVISTLPKLQHIYINKNQISDISSFKTLTKLQSIDANYNSISSLKGIGNLKRLDQLTMTNNQLTDVSALTSDVLGPLRKLYLNNNPNIKAISKFGKNLINLKEINLADTGISNIDFLTPIINLESLVLDNNLEIPSLAPISNITSLKNLHVSNNNISDLNGITELTKISFMDLKHNNISSLKPIVKMMVLKVLFLEGNPIADSTNKNDETCPTGEDVPEVIRKFCAKKILGID